MSAFILCSYWAVLFFCLIMYVNYRLNQSPKVLLSLKRYGSILIKISYDSKTDKLFYHAYIKDKLVKKIDIKILGDCELEEERLEEFLSDLKLSKENMAAIKRESNYYTVFAL